MSPEARAGLKRLGVAVGAGLGLWLLATGSGVRAAEYDANGNVAPRVVGGRPHGCPHAFCGCEASIYLFGRIVPALNLAANWIRKFPRAHPAPGMAAARRHHVMVLIRHINGSDWLVHDGNSGRHLTREHVRSIAGYVIVDPSIKLGALQ